jgi:hypothetical protein
MIRDRPTFLDYIREGTSAMFRRLNTVVLCTLTERIYQGLYSWPLEYSYVRRSSGQRSCLELFSQLGNLEGRRRVYPHVISFYTYIEHNLVLTRRRQVYATRVI